MSGGFICVRHEDGFLCRGKFREDGVFANCNVVFRTTAEVSVSVDKTSVSGTRHWHGDNSEREQLFSQFLAENKIAADAVEVVAGLER